MWKIIQDTENSFMASFYGEDMYSITLEQGDEVTEADIKLMERIETALNEGLNNG